MRLGKIKEVVLDILETTPAARDDDMVLYALACKKFNPHIDLSGSFSFVLINHECFSIPNYDSVGRCRRKIQAERPDLQSSEEAKRVKAERIAEYREFSRS